MSYCETKPLNNVAAYYRADDAKGEYGTMLLRRSRHRYRLYGTMLLCGDCANTLDGMEYWENADIDIEQFDTPACDWCGCHVTSSS